jgi:hypothetical protein
VLLLVKYIDKVFYILHSFIIVFSGSLSLFRLFNLQIGLQNFKKLALTC